MPWCIYHGKKYLRDNITFLKKIKKLKTIKKIIITGSCFEYKNKYGRKVERDKVNHIDEFPKTKLKIFNFLKKNFKSQYKYAWFRVFYAYGLNQRKGSLIPYLLNSLKNKNTVEVRNPNLSNDFIYTADIAKIINKSLEVNFRSGIYNLGSGKPKAIKGIINAIEKISKKKLKVKLGLNKDKKIFYANMDKTNKTFKNRKYTSLKQGIKNILFKI
jgi:UDP-glucose 4-epimerase